MSDFSDDTVFFLKQFFVCWFAGGCFCCCFGFVSLVSCYIILAQLGLINVIVFNLSNVELDICYHTELKSVTHLYMKKKNLNSVEK